MTFRGRQLNTEPLFVSLASLKEKMSNIRSPEFLKPIAGEHLFKRDISEPMSFPAEDVEQMCREDIFREAPRDRSLTGLLEESIRTGKEKKAYEEMFIQKYPERYAQLGSKDITGQRGLQEAVSKGIITEEEASMLTSTEVFPQIGAMGIIKGMTKPLAQQILKVGKKATEKQIDVAFKKALHQPEVKEILRGLTKESGAKEMDLLTGARDILLKGVPKVKETVKLLEKPFTGLPDLTLKTVEKLKGKTSVSHQYIRDLSNMPELKQVERNLIRETLDELPIGSVKVKEFADKISMKLLPLKTHSPMREPRYENISLPAEQRGNIANYFERIYDSSIKTSAGNVHFEDAPNYFAHTRVEDLVSKGEIKSLNNLLEGKVKSDTRRIIELQSDLFQKGALERELTGAVRLPAGIEVIKKTPQRASEVAKLEPYRNIWHERIIREEIKKAAQDSKTKLQFPTGETAMKVEGLGEARIWYKGAGKLTPDKLKVGEMVSQQTPAYRQPQNEWIITDILGEGKFKAVPKKQYNLALHPQGTKLNSALRAEGYETLADLPKMRREKFIQNQIEAFTEQFDISGKVDTSNPIYRFYEKEVQKYLKRIRPDMKQITDPQGVTWFEVPITAKDKISPIEAFSGLIGAGLLKEKSRLEK